MNFIFTIESIEHQKDTRIFFVDPQGNALDHGAKILFNKKRVEHKSNYSPNQINKETVHNKKFFSICIEINKSLKFHFRILISFKYLVL